MQICRVTKVNGVSMETFNLFTIHLFSGFLVSVVSVASVAFALVVRPEKMNSRILLWYRGFISWLRPLVPTV